MTDSAHSEAFNTACKNGAGVSLSKECHLLIKNITVAKFFLEVFISGVSKFV